MNAKQIREDEAAHELTKAKLTISEAYWRKVGGKPEFHTIKRESPLRRDRPRRRKLEARTYGERLADGFAHVD